MATSRLRKAFRYPDEGDVAGEPAEGIDEQEQEKIISHIEHEDAASSTFYRNIFLAICGVILLLYSLGPLFSSGLAESKSLLLLCFLSSFLSLVMVFDIPIARIQEQSAQSGATGLDFLFSARDPGDWRNAAITLLRAYTMPLNAALTALALIIAWVGNSEPSVNGSPLAAAAPCIVAFMVSVFARYELRPVDVQSLTKLRYDYKGA